MTLSLAILQTAGQLGEVEANLDELRDAATEARARGTQLLVTPELFITGYNLLDRLDEVAHVDWQHPVADIARELDIGLIVGAPEVAPTEGGFYNSAFYFDRSGTLRAVYRKTHLFGAGERLAFIPGDQLVKVIDIEGVATAILICYDVEFPEAVRACADSGADLIVVPTAQMEPFSWVAETVIPVRAWESQLYVAYANHAGAERDLSFVGCSRIVGPSGQDLAAAKQESRRILFATIDPRVVARSRTTNPYLADRRRDLY